MLMTIMGTVVNCMLAMVRVMSGSGAITNGRRGRVVGFTCAGRAARVRLTSVMVLVVMGMVELRGTTTAGSVATTHPGRIPGTGRVSVGQGGRVVNFSSGICIGGLWVRGVVSRVWVNLLLLLLAAIGVAAIQRRTGRDVSARI